MEIREIIDRLNKIKIDMINRKNTIISILEKNKGLLSKEEIEDYNKETIYIKESTTLIDKIIAKLKVVPINEEGSPKADNLNPIVEEIKKYFPDVLIKWNKNAFKR